MLLDFPRLSWLKFLLQFDAPLAAYLEVPLVADSDVETGPETTEIL